jgi:hypothetical protein
MSRQLNWTCVGGGKPKSNEAEQGMLLPKVLLQSSTETADLLPIGIV